MVLLIIMVVINLNLLALILVVVVDLLDFRTCHMCMATPIVVWELPEAIGRVNDLCMCV